MEQQITHAPMPKATEKFNPKLLLFFDFDGTIAPDTLDFILKENGQDPTEFRKKHIDNLVDDGWEVLLAMFYALISQRDELNLSKDSFEEMGKKLKPYEGVDKMFETIRKKAQDVLDNVEVEFFLISSGLLDIQEHNPILKNFKDTWGSRFAFDDEGKPIFVKNTIIHPEKSRYIMQQLKGMDTDGANTPADVFREIAIDDWYCPFDQSIYVGDGLSDMPAFELMEQNGGYSLGIVHKENVKEWKGYDKMHQNRRVMNLVKADYSSDSELMQSLILAVESITKEMALHKLSKGE